MVEPGHRCRTYQARTYRQEAPLETDRQHRFTMLYQAHAGSLLRFCLRRAPEADAKDIFSESFLVAWRRLDEIPADPLPWLLGVARKLDSNRRRSMNRRDLLHIKVTRMLPGDSHTDSSDFVHTRLAVEEALSQLGDWDREALTLLAWEGLDHLQAAAAMGCSPSVFKVRIHRARKRLSRMLDRVEDSSGSASDLKELEAT